MKQTLSNIVLFCGGANVKFLRDNCPNERHKFYPIGLGVLITTFLGFISMMFATHSIFNPQTFFQYFYLILFSMFWGFAIFSIDWGLVKTMRKKDDSSLSLFQKIGSAFPVLFRLAVAIIISFSVSRPIEAVIYSQRIKGQIEQDRQDFVRNEWEKKQKENAEKYNNRIDVLTSSIDGINSALSKGPQAESYKIALDDRKKCMLEYENLKRINESKINALNAQIGGIRKSSSSFTNGKMEKWAKSKINALNAQIGELKSAITIKYTQCSSKDAEISAADSIHSSNYASQRDLLLTEQNNLVLLLNIKRIEDSLALKKIQDVSYIAFNHINPGLITQLESMSNLEKTPQGKSVGWVRIILLLLIICIDTAPIVIKLLTKRGVYEVMLDADEERMRFLTKQEGYSNNYLITQLSLAQKEILTEAVKRWKTKEKDREGMEDDYVNSNQQNNGNGNA
jgi:hypothetical protein